MVRRAFLARRTQPDLIIHSHPNVLPDLPFTDGNGAPTSLAAFRGRVVVLNVWATWCLPCREEMPTLDRLQATLAGPGFEVVAVSIDRDGMPVVREFFARQSIRHLHPYVDASGDALSILGVAGIPLTLLVDRDGREVARKLGPAVWDHPEVIKMIRGYSVPAATPFESVRR